MQISPLTQPALAPQSVPQTLAFQDYDFSWYDKAMAELVEYEMKKMKATSEAEFKSYDKMQDVKHQLLDLEIVKEFHRVRRAVRSAGLGESETVEASTGAARARG